MVCCNPHHSYVAHDELANLKASLPANHYNYQASTSQSENDQKFEKCQRC